MFLDNRGDTAYTIVRAIVIIALIAILFYFFVEFVIIGKESSNRDACRTSVLLSAKSKLLGKPLIEDLRCATEFSTIKTDNTDDIKMEITNKMYDCWYQFGEHGKDFVNDWGEKRKWAFICSRLDFDERISKNVDTINSLTEFWANKPLPFKEDMTFYDYFYGAVPNDFLLSLSTKEPIYIVFVGTKYNLASELANEDPKLASQIYAYRYGTISLETSPGLPEYLGAVLVGKVYSPDFHGNLIIGNSRDILLALDAKEAECNSGDTGSCKISGKFGLCAEGNRICSDKGEWLECKQTLFERTEICGSGLDEDCDGTTDCEDLDCDEAICGDNMKCINRQCVGV